MMGTSMCRTWLLETPNTEFLTTRPIHEDNIVQIKMYETLLRNTIISGSGLGKSPRDNLTVMSANLG